MTTTRFPTLQELRSDWRNLKFHGTEMWVIDATQCTYNDAEERLHNGRWTADQFEAYALVWAQNKTTSEAANYRRLGAGNATVQYLVHFLAEVMNISLDNPSGVS